MNVQQWMNTIGLGIDLLGAVVLASSLVVSKKQAIEEGTSRWAAETDEENLQLPMVQKILRGKWNAIIGVALLAIGFLVQIIGSCLTA